MLSVAAASRRTMTPGGEEITPVMLSPFAAVALALVLLAQAGLPEPSVSPSPVATAVVSDELRHVGATPPPHGYPKIHDIALSTTDIKAGSRVHGSVVTSANVGYVEARIENYNLAMHADGEGRFS
ncbi:MAG: hypothetical protein JWN27_3855, partial [Candidatus Eremiobacteraeota bacterium]|nr:hypothetical protein [Candidatus Eremiobacteraeota bacterium]